MRAKEYIAINEINIEYLDDIKRVIKDLYPIRGNKVAMRDYFSRILMSDLRCKYDSKFTYNQGEIAKEIAPDFRRQIHDIIEEDMSFCWLMYLFWIIEHFEVDPKEIPTVHIPNNHSIKTKPGVTVPGGFFFDDYRLPTEEDIMQDVASEINKYMDHAYKLTVNGIKENKDDYPKDDNAPNKMNNYPVNTTNNTKGEYKYDVVFSFAGEDRVYVDKVANILKDKGVKVFYDDFEEVNLWGKDLAIYFDRIYSKDSRYAVLFVSKSYREKRWTIHELKMALQRALNQEEYILPAKFDDTKLDGISSNIKFIDLREKSEESFSEIILQKLGIAAQIKNK
jgi:hypothetical protein